MKASELEKLIKEDGWIFKTQKGSHRQYVHPTKAGKVTSPWHKGDLDIGTARSIMKQAGLL